jgi:dienelactone hydrolase
VIESYCGGDPANSPAVIVLHGSGGVQPSKETHAAQWRALNEDGYCVCLPHYLDSTGGSARDPGSHYGVWVRTVTDAVRFVLPQHPRGVALIGYSLGASVALATASQGSQIGVVVAWGGSLPDEYFQSFQRMPPALILHGQRDTVVPVRNAIQLERLCRIRSLECEVKLYPEEPHDFGPAATADAYARIKAFLRRFLPTHN